MSCITILHLSDFHFAKHRYRRKFARSPVYNHYIYERLARFSYGFRKSIDAILISGDIADIGNDTNLALGVELIGSQGATSPRSRWLNSYNNPTLQASGKPIIVVPGNHDRFERRYGDLGNLFYDYFSSFWNAGAGGVQSRLLPNKEKPKLAIICADFSLDDQNPASLKGGQFGQGRASAGRLAALQDETENIRNSHTDIAVIWMIHFAPQYEEHFPSWKPLVASRSELIGSEELVKAAQDVKVRHLLCGHSHKNKIYEICGEKGLRVHCAGSSACQVSDGTCIHIRKIYIENGQISRIKSLRISWKNKKFQWKSSEFPFDLS